MSGFGRVVLFVFSAAVTAAGVGVLWMGMTFASITPTQTPEQRAHRTEVVLRTAATCAPVAVPVLTLFLVLCVKAVVGHPKLYHEIGRHLLIAGGLAVLLVAGTTTVAVFCKG